MAATVVLDKLTEPSKSEGSMRVQAETDISVMGIPLKYAALAFLCAQNSCAVLVMRYTRSVESESQYLTSTAVIMGEIFKVVVSSFLAFYKGDEKISVIWANPVELAKTGVPAFLYLVQNNLQYVAVSNLHAATYQVTYQLKILSTAIMSVYILKKELTKTKWAALALLTAGVACVQISSMPAGKINASQANVNMPVGLAATIAACCCSGLAGVYFELILKKTDVGLWVRNIQLGLYSIVIGYTGYVLEIRRLGDAAPLDGFFHGYTGFTFFNIMVQSCGGLIIAVVIKYADNILKNFSTAISIIVSSIISWMFMGFNLTTLFIVGVAMVNYAVYLYGKRESPVIGGGSAGGSKV